MGQFGSRIELVEDLLSNGERTVMFHPDLESYLQKYSFLHNIDLAVYYLHFMLGSILTLPYTDLRAKLNLEHLYINYKKNDDNRPGLLKLIAIRQNPGTDIRTLVYRTLNFDTKFEGTTNFGTTDDVLQVLKILHDLGHNVDDYKIPPIYHYKFSQIEEGTNYVVFDEESSYQTIANDKTPIKIDYIRSHELASKVFQLSNLIVNQNFGNLQLEYMDILNLKATHELMHLPPLAIDELSLEQVKNFIKNFLETMGTVYRFHREKLPFLELTTNSLGSMAFTHGAITLNFKENARMECITQCLKSFLYESYNFARIELKTNSKLIGKSLFNMPIILQFSHIGYEYSSYNLIRQAKQFAKIRSSNLYRCDAKEALLNAVNFNHVVGVVQQVAMPLVKPPGVIQQILSIKQEDLQGQELMERTVKKLLTCIDYIYPENQLHFLDRGRYLSRYILGEASITQLQAGQSVYVADNVGKDYWKPLPWIPDKVVQETKDRVTTFVIGNEQTKIDIHLNIIEYTAKTVFDTENGQLANEILQRYQPKATSATVEKIVTINIWTSFHYAVEAFTISDRLPKDLIMIAESSQINYPRLVASRNLRPIDNINMNEQFKFTSENKIDEAILVTDPKNNDIFKLLNKHKNLLPESSDLEAFAEGLFSKMHYSKLNLHPYDSRKIEFAVFGDSAETKFIFALDLGRDYQSEFESTIQLLSDFQSIQSYVKNAHKFGNENFPIIAAATNGEEGHFSRLIIGQQQSQTTDIMAFLTQCMRNSRRKRTRNVCPKSKHVSKKVKDKLAHMKESSGSKKPTQIGQHLERLGRVANIMMLSLIGKNMIADLIKEDYLGVAINVGFLAGATALTFFGNKLESYGTNLAIAGNVIRGNIFKISASLLGRVMAGFVIYDLIGNIKQYEESHDVGLVANIAADSGFLLIEGAQISILGLEYAGLISGVSSMTGPIGAAIGAAMLLGADIYNVVHKLQQLNENLDLTIAEKWLTGLRAFVGIEPKQYLIDLIEERKANEHILNKMLQNLPEDISYVVMPTAFTKSKRIYIQPNNEINMINGTWNRAPQQSMPNLPSSMEFFCYPVEKVKYHMCKDSFGVKFKHALGGSVLMEILDGNDTVYGKQNMKNLFHMANGNKTILGGTKNDQFVLTGDETTGFLDGSAGYNTLNLANFRQKDFIRVDENFISYSDDVHVYRHKIKKIFFYNMQEIIGRRGQPEIIIATCRTETIASGGGNLLGPDMIVIYDSELCNYSMNIILNSWTFIDQYAQRGLFNYVVESNLTGDVQIKMLSKHSQAQHTLVVKDTLEEVKKFVFNETYTEIEFQHNSVKMINFEKPALKFYMGNACMLDIGQHMTIYKVLNTTDNIENVMSRNLNIINRFEAIMVIFMSLTNKTIIMGQMQKTIDEKHVTFENDPLHETHIFGGDAENTYTIKSKGMQTLTTPPVFIYEAENSNSSDILNLEFYQKSLRYQYSSDEIHLKVDSNVTDIQIQVVKTNSTRNETLVTIHLPTFLEQQKFRRLLIVNHYLSVLVMDQGQAKLKPLPLEFNENSSIIGISNYDIEWRNEIIIRKNLTEFILFNYEDEDLIVTNIFSMQQGNQVLTILLKNFYKSAKMKSMIIRFENSITLKMNEERYSNPKMAMNYVEIRNLWRKNEKE